MLSDVTAVWGLRGWLMIMTNSNRDSWTLSHTIRPHRIGKHNSNDTTTKCCDVLSGIAWKYRPDHYAVDGLNSLRYKLVATEARPLYTWLLVTLPPHPTYFTGTYRVGAPGHASSNVHIELYFLITMLLCVTVTRTECLLLWWGVLLLHLAALAFILPHDAMQSVCLSRSCIVPIRLDVSSTFFYHVTDSSFQNRFIISITLKLLIS